MLPEFAKEGMTFLAQTCYDAFNAVGTIIIRCIVHWPMPSRSMTIPAMLRMRREMFGVSGEGEGGEFANPASRNGGKRSRMSLIMGQLRCIG